MSGRKDITGQRFGRLVVIGYDHTKAKRAFWQCRCDCGNETVVCGKLLRGGDTKSCGCLKREGQSNPRHGHARHGKLTPVYITWLGMMRRCHTKSSGNYRRYGGRGIAVCERWRMFENFLADMGPRPDGMSIDRIDPNGNYEPNNCRWLTAKEQTANRRPLTGEHKQKALVALAQGRQTRWGKSRAALKTDRA